MNQLCINWQEEQPVFVRGTHLGLASPLYPILIPFAVMEKCKLFNEIWSLHYNQQPQLIQQKQLIEKVWNASINDCIMLVGTCVDGSAIVTDLEKLFDDNWSQEELTGHLEKLYNRLNSINLYHLTLSKDESWAVNVSKKFESYRISKRCEESAITFLNLKELLKLKGCFNLLDSVAKKVNVSFIYNVII